MRYPTLALYGLALTSLLNACFAPVSSAQVSSDGSLGTQVVSPDGRNFRIRNGSLQGQNLFHSFRDFSVPTGGSAVFDLVNTPNATAIFSRVTGGNLSTIDGLLRTTGSTNPVSLFLLNPNGIIFGPNSQLNISGSFLGTTANSIRFADGTRFAADSTSPLLTISAPLGLQMGQNPGAIVVQSKLPGGEFGLLTGLQVRPGQSLALIGGNVSLEQSGLRAIDGHILIGSVGDNQSVQLSTTQGLKVGYESVSAFRDITLVNTSAVSTSGMSGGSIQLQGRQIRLTNGSVLLANTMGSGNGGGITVNASESLETLGMDRSGSIPSGLFSQVFPTGTGRGGDLIINSPILRMIDGAQSGTGTFGAGRAGDVIVRSQDILARGISANQRFNSGLRTTVLAGATGQGGDLSIETQKLQVLDGAQIGAGTFGAGSSGTLSIKATDVEIAGSSPRDIYMSGLFTQVTPSATGQGGDFNLQTQRLTIRDGGVVSADTYGDGNAGRLRVDAEQISVMGVSKTGRSPSSLGAGVLTARGFPIGRGNGANVTLNTNSLQITGGGQVSTSTDGNGNAGNIVVTANRIEIVGSGQLADARRTPSRLTATATSSFSAGAIALTANQIEVREGGEISVSSTSNGNAGNLNITTRSLELRNRGSLRAETTAGNQGSINVNADLLLLRQGGNITTNATQTASGGNITINAPVILGLENSDIVANAVQGRGGNIDITTQGIIGLQFRDRVTSESDITASSEFGINGTVQINNIGVDPNSGLVELPTDLTDASQQIAQGCLANQGSSFVVTGRGGMPINPQEQLNHRDRAWADLRDLSSLRQAAQPPMPQTTTTVPSLVEAASWHRNPQTGKVELVAAQATRFTQAVTCVGMN